MPEKRINANDGKIGKTETREPIVIKKESTISSKQDNKK